MRYTKDISAAVAHQIWEEVADIGREAHDVIAFMKHVEAFVFPAFGISLPPGQPLESWESRVALGHEKIDEWFGQKVPFDTQEYKHRHDHIATGIIPCIPTNITSLTRSVNAVKAVANAVRATEQGLVLMEEMSPLRSSISVLEEIGSLQSRMSAISENLISRDMSSSLPIRIQLNGIWEVEGNLIKRVDLNAALTDNKIKHFFKDPRHNFKELGVSPHALIEKITEEVIKADLAGIIQENLGIRVMINGFEVEVRGRIIDGELRYGTLFMPE